MSKVSLQNLIANSLGFVYMENQIVPITSMWFTHFGDRDLSVSLTINQ